MVKLKAISKDLDKDRSYITFSNKNKRYRYTVSNVDRATIEKLALYSIDKAMAYAKKVAR